MYRMRAFAVTRLEISSSCRSPVDLLERPAGAARAEQPTVEGLGTASRSELAVQAPPGATSMPLGSEPPHRPALPPDIGRMADVRPAPPRHDQTELPQRRRRVSGNDTAMANEQYDPVLSGALGPLNRARGATVLMVIRVTIAECQVCAELRLLGRLVQEPVWHKTPLPRRSVPRRVVIRDRRW